MPRAVRPPMALSVLVVLFALAGCGDSPPTEARGATGSPGAASPSPSGQYVFPVRHGKPGYGRWHAASPATDIFAPCGVPVVAVTDGVVLEVNRVDQFRQRPKDGAAKGGQFVSVAGDDGVRYYGSHLSVVDAKLKPGTRVKAGEQLGLVGRTGNSSNICHLHFGISPPCRGTGDWWIRRGVVYPWPYLDAWRAGTARSPVPAIATWHKTHGCPTGA